MPRRPRPRSERAILWIAGHPRAIAWATGLVVLCAALAHGHRVGWDPSHVPMNNGADVWFVEGDPTLTAYRDFEGRFPRGEEVVVAFHDPAGVVEPRGLTWVDQASRRLARLPWVESVSSLATLRACQGDGDSLVIGPLYQAPVDGSTSATVTGQVDSEPLIAQLLSRDRRTTLLSVHLIDSPETTRERSLFLAAARGVLDEVSREVGLDADAWRWGGTGVLHEESNALTQRDATRLGIWAMLAGLAVLALCFRRASAVLLAGATVLLASTVLVTAAIGAGHEVNLVTMVVPTLVLVIGVTDAVYFITAFREGRAELEAQGHSRREVLARTLGPCLVPASFNTLTTAVGFLGFLATDMAVLQQLGLLAASGIVLALLSTLALCTLVMDRWDLGAAPKGRGARLRAGLEHLTTVLTERRRPVLLAGAALLAASLLGVAQLTVDTYTLNQFWEDHPLREADRFIEDRYGPYLPLDTVIDSGTEDGVREPRFLAGLDALGRRLEEREPRLDRAVSLAPLVKRMRGALAGEDRLPEARAGVDQLLLLYDGGPQDPLGPLEDTDRRVARMTLRCSLGSTQDADALLGRLDGHVAETLPDGVRFAVTGIAPLYVRLNQYLIEGQVRSLALTFALVFAMIAVLFRSLRYALVAVPPNLVPAVITLGFMGWAGIPLDSATVIVGALVLAVSVDDTVHLLHRFRAAYEASGDPEAALRGALRLSGQAVVVTTLTLVAGLSVLGLAGMRSVAVFGGVLALGIACALACELVLTPLLLLACFPRVERARRARYRVSARLERLRSGSTVDAVA